MSDRVLSQNPITIYFPAIAGSCDPLSPIWRNNFSHYYFSWAPALGRRFAPGRSIK